MKIWDDAPLRWKGFVVIGIPLIPLVVTGLLFLLGARNAGTMNDWMGRANRAETQLATVLRLAVDADAAALPPAIAQLRALVFDSPAQVAHVQKVSALAGQLPVPPDPESAESRATVHALRDELGAMQELQDRLIAERAALTRRVLVWLAEGGAIFGLLFGILGMLAFVTGIVRRIDRLRANAGRLARGEALLPPQIASDEVGELSRSLHEAARLLRLRDEEAREHAAELSAVNQELEAFSYSVSHDLRAPLRHVTGFASLLQKSAGDRLDEKETRYVRTIVEAATRMGRLIDDLLAFSRMGRAPLQRTRVSLDAVVREARQDLARADGGVEISWNLHPLPEVHGDAALLRQVFVNLLSNAAKYSGARPQPAVEVGIEPGNGEETVIYVRDNGVGFDMAYVDKLFGVFQRLHSADAFEGTGIGLANVRRIVHRHGGRVWAEGAVDAGATFYVSLPQTGET
jgi:signal transduction histidine kinase